VHTGSVHNGGTALAPQVTINVVATSDPGGNQVGSGSQALGDIAAGADAAYNVTVDLGTNPPNQWYVHLALDYQKSVVGVSQESIQRVGGTVTVTGTLKNFGHAAATNVTVTRTLLDAGGHVVASGQVSLGQVGPGHSVPVLGAGQALVLGRQLAAHEAVVSINLAGRLSTTLDVARQAAATVDAARISVLDSGTFTRGLGWMLEAAARLADEGAGPEEIARVVAAMKPRVRIFAILDTLEYLQRGGRIGRAAALAGTLLSVKPILEITDGEVRPLERVRTLTGAIRRLVETGVAVGEVERLAVMHGDAEAGARELERQLQPHVPRLTVEHGEIGSVLGVHAGPGVFGVAVLLAG